MSSAKHIRRYTEIRLQQSEAVLNAKIARQYDIVKLYRQLRDDLTAELTDEDLAYSPGGENAPLGVICREMGETQKGVHRVVQNLHRLVRLGSQ